MANQSKSFSKKVFRLIILVIILGLVYFVAKSNKDTDEISNYLNIATTTDQVKQNGDRSISEYKHAQPNFSFKYPSHFEVSDFKEGDGSSTIVFKDVQTKNGFQIYVSRPKQNIVLTKESIKRILFSMI
jgi:hypothetical protein